MVIMDKTMNKRAKTRIQAERKRIFIASPLRLIIEPIVCPLATGVKNVCTRRGHWQAFENAVVNEIAKLTEQQKKLQYAISR